MWVSERALHRPVFVLSIAAALMVLGIVSFFAIPVERDPEITVPYIFVTLPYPGASPDEVEADLTRPVEEKLAALEGVDYTFSSSREGGASIGVVFLDDVDIADAKQRVKDVVDRARPDFPEESEHPIVEDWSFTDLPLIYVALSGERDLLRLRRLGEDLKDEFQAIPGVAGVEIFGGIEREVRVEVDPFRMNEYGVTFDDVHEAIRQGHLNMPGGKIRGPASDDLMRTIGKPASARALAETVVGESGGFPIRLEYFATVEETAREPQSYARYGGADCVILILHRKTGINTFSAVDAVKARVESLRGTMPSGLSIHTTLDTTREIRVMLETLSGSAVQGMIVVAVMLIASIGWRNSAMVLTALPFTIVVTTLVLYLTGNTINNIVIFSFILIIGMVVDGAIVVIENIHRHRQLGASPMQAASRGIAEVGPSVLAADLTTIAGFAPLILFGGLTGQFLRLMPIVVALALAASLIIDHFLLPVMSSRLRMSETAGEGRLLTAFKSWYGRLLERLLGARGAVIGASLLLLVAAVWLVAGGVIKVEVFPDVGRGRFTVNLEMPVGTPLDRTAGVTTAMEAAVRPQPGVESFVSTMGDTWAVVADVREGGAVGAEFARVTVELPERHGDRPDERLTMDAIAAGIAPSPDADVYITRIKEGPPGGAPIAVRVIGADLDAIEATAAAVAEKLSAIPGALDVRVNLRRGRTDLAIRPDRDKAGRFNIPTRAIARTLYTAFHGSVPAEFDLADRKIDIRVIADRPFRASPASLDALFVRAPDGARLPLASLCDVSAEPGLYEIPHRNGKRTATVRADVHPDATAAQVLEALQASMPAPPPGVRIEYGGEQEETARSFAFLTKALVAAIVMIFFILAAQFNSFRQPLAVLSAVPMAFVGVAFGLLVTGHRFSILVFLGVVALVGIAVNDAIVLVSYTNQLRERGRSLREAVIEAAVTRLRPVFLTSVTTIGGLLPLALQLGGASPFWVPLAWSIIFGIASATLLTLLVLPCLLVTMERREPSINTM